MNVGLLAMTKGPRCQFPASADQAVEVFVVVTDLCNRKLSTPIIGFSIIKSARKICTEGLILGKQHLFVQIWFGSNKLCSM